MAPGLALGVAGVAAAAGAGAAVDVSRAMRSDGCAAAGASIAGASIAAAVLGASISAEYSRISRPWPQSTSIRKLSDGTSTGMRLLTWITARPLRVWVKRNCRSLTRPCGRSSPTRAKVAGEASATRARSSSPGSLEITGISARKGSPGLDSTRISPRPRASAAWLQASNSSAAAARQTWRSPRTADTASPRWRRNKRGCRRIPPLPLGVMSINIYEAGIGDLGLWIRCAHCSGGGVELHGLARNADGALALWWGAGVGRDSARTLGR
ncbi:hypothetical protein NB697_001544 [Xanthomonas sacchari]|nr:hypothetical protein [Xanthomonas sacchari]